MVNIKLKDINRYMSLLFTINDIKTYLFMLGIYKENVITTSSPVHTKFNYYACKVFKTIFNFIVIFFT